jgi:hypothetical protein
MQIILESEGAEVTHFTFTTGYITLEKLREYYKLLIVIKDPNYLRSIGFDAEVYNIMGYCGV